MEKKTANETKRAIKAALPKAQNISISYLTRLSTERSIRFAYPYCNREEYLAAKEMVKAMCPGMHVVISIA